MGLIPRTLRFSPAISIVFADKPVLSRGLGVLSNLAVGFTETGALSGMVVVFSLAVGAGGPCVLFWGFLVCSIMSTVVSYSMAEICGYAWSILLYLYLY
jgi:hypothetical protein